jgi:AcrR family transcriptional regulator
MPKPSKYDDLLDAAEVIVRRDGSAKLTLDAVAAEAGVSKGGLLYHFPSKEALISALVERMIASYVGAQESAVERDQREPGSWTRAYVRVTAGSGSRSEHDATSAALLAAITADPSLIDPLRERYAQWRARIDADGLDPDLATILSLAADGLWLADLLNLAPLAGAKRKRVVKRMLEMAGGA